MPEIHVAVLVAIPLVTGLVCWRWRGPRQLRSVAASAAWVVIGTLVVAPSLVTTCGPASFPTTQLAVPAFSLLAVGATVSRPRVRRTSMAALWVAMVAMGFWYLSVVDGPRYSDGYYRPGTGVKKPVPEWHSAITGIYRRTASTESGCSESGPLR